MDLRYTVDTPENIEFAYDIAGIGSRFLAAVVDTILILIGQGIIFLIVGLSIASLKLGQSVINAGAAILSFVLLWGYYIAFEMAWNGQSPGKRLIGLRVVREGGRPITFVASMIRNLVRLVDFLPALYGIGVIAIFADKRSRRLGDLAAGVIVVREQNQVTLASLTAKPTKTAAPTLSTHNQMAGVENLDQQSFLLAVEFLDRREQLAREARSRIAQQIAHGIELRLGKAGQENAEETIEHAVMAYRAYQDFLAVKANSSDEA